MSGNSERSSEIGSSIIEPKALIRHQQVVHKALGEMILNGVGVGHQAVAETTISELSKDSEFRIYVPDEPRRGTGSRRPIFTRPNSFIESTFLSAKRRPNIGTYTRLLIHNVRSFGITNDVEPLAEWQVDRVVVNKLGPNKHTDQPGQLFRHSDPPSFMGMVAALRLSPARSTVWLPDGDRHEPTSTELAPGDISFYAAADLSKSLGIDQVEHQISTDQEGLSLVFLHDPEHKPFGIGSVVERTLRK